MKKIFQILGLLASLFFHAPAWGDMADNGIECSVVMEKASFDPRAAFPDFKLVFANKGEKAVRLFDDFYPLKERGPNMIIKIWSRGNLFTTSGQRENIRIGSTFPGRIWRSGYPEGVCGEKGFYRH